MNGQDQQALADSLVLVILAATRPDEEVKAENLRAIGMNEWTPEELLSRLAGTSAIAGAYAEAAGVDAETLAQRLALKAAEVEGW